MKVTIKPKAIICDIDGTLALAGARGTFEWNRVIEDRPNFPIIGILNTYQHLDRENPHWEPTRVILVTGREDTCREDTKTWMEHNGVEFDELYMRNKGDRRPDYEVKKEIYDTHIKHRFTVLFVLEDRDQAVKFWRSEGLTCLQVAEGNF